MSPTEDWQIRGLRALISILCSIRSPQCILKGKTVQITLRCTDCSDTKNDNLPIIVTKHNDRFRNTVHIGRDGRNNAPRGISPQRITNVASLTSAKLSIGAAPGPTTRGLDTIVTKRCRSEDGFPDHLCTAYPGLQHFPPLQQFHFLGQHPY